MRAAVLQLSAQGMSSTKLYNYIRVAHKQGVKVLLLGEYILNPFFKELQELSTAMIQEQALHQIKVLKELSKTYNMNIIAPIVIVKKAKVFKTIAKFSPSSTTYYEQQILINYPHWNEEKFFANEIKELESPLIFKVDGFKFAIMSGFELHFDAMFSHLSSRGVDCILLPSVSTFESYERWKALILSRSFTNNCYILRANRIGEYIDKKHSWNFYGDSLLASPNGELLEHLGNKEELMIVDMSHANVMAAKKSWGFRDALNKRSGL
ncbi:Nitrilase/cyanide hydratase and apolipoprotein N-acyltransferase [Sulfurimonas denitrificans DSM 1251]|uniref:Nitrilase/cyanide hydratase and apolipoprotein N-acyltransferase n=1 Tax=Sulfurimonas denitrificans (strain ATCC 33889 / DSM 1251) TaxID=326298 RepID=Q30SJ0_SULDN|nr:carbon-nitrogen hydrolase family protein [Sulfurimonas denitrificans]ABB44041.1 Nitrilase/cyanide hydratase and apolipoprotein N-acyltransferase [Sulfurimonas denitrificans DSM 1251]MDD3443401.1 carbon-nitrogen hydrolase family protein [Sulfurimonas denitrificans]